MWLTYQLLGYILYELNFQAPSSPGISYSDDPGFGKNSQEVHLVAWVRVLVETRVLHLNLLLFLLHRFQLQVKTLITKLVTKRTISIQMKLQVLGLLSCI